MLRHAPRQADSKLLDAADDQDRRDGGCHSLHSTIRGTVLIEQDRLCGLNRPENSQRRISPDHPTLGLTPREGAGLLYRLSRPPT